MQKIIIAFFLLGSLASCNQSKNPELIKHVINTTFDKADSKVKIDPVVVTQPYAVAGWVQGEKAGRALLKLENGKWQLLACGGKGMKTATALMQQGVPENIAVELEKQLSAAETDISNNRVEAFDNFGPNVTFNDSNSHQHQK